MENISRNKAINIDDLLNNGEKVIEAEVVKETPAAAIVDDDDLIIEDDENVGKPAGNAAAPKEEEYTGPGVIVDKADLDASKAKQNNGDIVVNSVKEETMNSVKDYMADQDKEIADLKDKAAKMQAQGITPAAKQPGSVVNIYLDKANVGKLEFTPEQQKVLERASKIIVNEQTKLDFSTYKFNKLDDMNSDEASKKKIRILEKAFDRTLSPFVALGSGYMGKMGNCSTAEVMKLARAIDSGRDLNSEIERWTLLYNKMKQCSLGKFKDFDDFLNNTAYDDYENLQYALICASFPETTTLQFTCAKCQKKFNVTVKNKELLRTDTVDETMAAFVEKIVTAGPVLEEAQKVHTDAPFNKITRISLNEDTNDTFLDLYTPSAHDAIYRTYQELSSSYRDAADYSGYVDMVKMIKDIGIYDFEADDGSFIMFDKPDEIVQALHMFSELQLNKLGLFISESYLAHKYQYGLKEVVCPNPDCKHNLGVYPMDMDNLLFLKVRQQGR